MEGPECTIVLECASTVSGVMAGGWCDTEERNEDGDAGSENHCWSSSNIRTSVQAQCVMSFLDCVPLFWSSCCVFLCKCPSRSACAGSHFGGKNLSGRDSSLVPSNRNDLHCNPLPTHF